MSVLTRNRVRFGPFELDPQSGELFKLGHKLNLHGQPIEVLSILLERPGEVVTREELCQRLWPQDTFVDFEHSLNTAIKKLRQSLDDDPDSPRYIETLPKKGYRFIAQVEIAPNGVASPVPDLANGLPDTPVISSSVGPPPRPLRWIFAAAIILILAIAAGGLYWLYRPRTPVVTAIHQLTRTGNAKYVYHGLRPVETDGTRLYFNVWREGKYRPAQMSVKGGEVSLLDMPPIQRPWILGSAADGSQLLIFDFEPDVVNDRLQLFSLPNGPPRRIGKVTAYNATITPDAQHVLYTQAPNLKQLFIADVDTGEERPLFTAPGNIGPVSVSPDGRRARFNTVDGISEALLDGSGPHRFLPQHQAHICCGNWSSDGKTYAFASENADGYNLWAVTESGSSSHSQSSRPVQLTNGPISFTYPRFSKDGKQIFVFGQTRLGELSVFDSASGQFRPYLNGISAGFLDFSRDGQWIVYVSYPQNTLWRSRIDGSDHLQLTFPPMGSVVNPKWSPDGRFIVFTEWNFPNSKIYLVPADGGAPLLLLAGDFLPGNPTWSPDGKSIAYSGAYLSPQTEIRILDLDSKHSRTIPGSQHKFSSRWSPDGRFLVALSDDVKRLFLYNFETALWKELFLPTKGSIGWPTWSHDSHYLYLTWNGMPYRLQIPDGRAELAADIRAIDRTSPVYAAGDWFGLTHDDRILVLRNRGTDELYALDLEYR